MVKSHKILILYTLWAYFCLSPFSRESRVSNTDEEGLRRLNYFGFFPSSVFRHSKPLALRIPRYHPPEKAMAGVLTTRPLVVLRPPNWRGKSTRSVKVSAELRETSSSSASLSVSSAQEEGQSSGPSSLPATLSPPPGFKPPQPKRFSVRPDKFLDILSASLALPFRLGSGAFVLGFGISLSYSLSCNFI